MMIMPPRFAAYPLCEDALWRSVQRAMMASVSPADAVRRAAAEVHGIVAAHDRRAPLQGCRGAPL